MAVQGGVRTRTDERELEEACLELLGKNIRLRCAAGIEERRKGRECIRQLVFQSWVNLRRIIRGQDGMRQAVCNTSLMSLTRSCMRSCRSRSSARCWMIHSRFARICPGSWNAASSCSSSVDSALHQNYYLIWIKTGSPVSAATQTSRTASNVRFSSASSRACSCSFIWDPAGSAPSSVCDPCHSKLTARGRGPNRFKSVSDKPPDSIPSRSSSESWMCGTCFESASSSKEIADAYVSPSTRGCMFSFLSFLAICSRWSCRILARRKARRLSDSQDWHPFRMSFTTNSS